MYADNEGALCDIGSGPGVIKLLSCPTYENYHAHTCLTDFVGILTFVSTINTPTESLKARKDFIFSILVFIRAAEFSC